MGYEAVGLDHNFGVDQSSNELHEHFPGVEVYCLPLAQTPWPLESQTFDLVVSNHVIEHLCISPKPFVKEIMRVLKPGGWAYVSNPNPGRLSSRLRALLGKRYYPSGIEQYFETFGQPTHRGHVREFTSSELHYMFAYVGFRNIRSGTHNLWYLRVRMRLAKLVALAATWFPSLRACAYVVAQK